MSATPAAEARRPGLALPIVVLGLALSTCPLAATALIAVTPALPIGPGWTLVAAIAFVLFAPWYLAGRVSARAFRSSRRRFVCNGLSTFGAHVAIAVCVLGALGTAPARLALAASAGLAELGQDDLPVVGALLLDWSEAARPVEPQRPAPPEPVPPKPSLASDKLAAIVALAPKHSLFEWQDEAGVHFTQEPPKKAQRIRVVKSEVGRKTRKKLRAQQAAWSKDDLVGKPAPELIGRTSADGKYRRSKKRAPTWILFSTLRCTACDQALVLEPGVSVPEGAERVIVLRTGGKDRIQRFIEQKHVDEKHVVSVAPDAYPLGSVPYHVFVDADGKVAKTHRGALTKDALSEALQSLSGKK